MDYIRGDKEIKKCTHLTKDTPIELVQLADNNEVPHEWIEDETIPNAEILVLTCKKCGEQSWGWRRTKPILSVDTPAGKLVAELSTDPDYPGIIVSLNDEVISVTECDIDNNVQTFAYVHDQEDRESKTIWKEGSKET